MIVGVSDRVVQHHVGGNTRYVTELQKHLPSEAIEYRRLGAGRARLRGTPGVEYLLAEASFPFSRRRDGLDLIHYPADTGPVVRGAVPVVTTIHGMASLHVDSVRSPAQARAWRLRAGRAAASSQRVITVSTSSATDVMRAFAVPARRLAVIPHGIDHARFHPDTDGDEAVLAPLRLPERFVLYLGNLEPRKNVGALLRSFEDPRLRRDGVPLIVAGRPAWGAREVLKAIDRAPAVRYLGGVPEHLVAPLMRRATVFAFPSLYEGFGFPVLEAMACGTPVVCSDRGSLSEVAGTAARIADPLDSQHLAAAIHQVWSDDDVAGELRSAGLANAAAYTWAASARRHRECFEEVVARG